MTRNFLRVFVLSLLCSFFPISDTMAQCGLLTGNTNETFLTTSNCAPTTVNWTIEYQFFTGQDPTRVYVRFFWADPGNNFTTVLASKRSPTDSTWMTASASFTYPAGTDCSYRPQVFVIYDADGNGSLPPSEFCLSSIIFKDVNAWSDDNSNSGVLAINPVLQQVCVDDSTVNFQFQDNTTNNCNVATEPDRPNEFNRWVQFIYGTGAGPHIPNVSIDTGGGTVQITDAAGTVVNQFRGPIIEYTIPVLQGDLNQLSYPISHPTGADIGDVFEVTLRNWNVCNPYDSLPFDPFPPGDPVDGDQPAITTTAQLEIIGPTPAAAGPDQDICAFNTTFSGNTPATGTGTWTQLTGTQTATITNVNDPNSAVSIGSFGGGTEFQTYTFEWSTALGGCATSVDTVQITFYRDPTNPNAGPDQDICGLTTTMSANNINRGTGQWVQTGGPAANPGFSSVFDRNATLDVSTSGYGVYTFDWTASNPPCATETNEIVVTFEQDPTNPDAGPDDTTVCNSLNYTMQGNAITVGTGTWSKVSGPGGAITFPDANDENTTITLPTYGTFVLRWTASNGTICPDETDDVTITAFQTPTVANAGNDSTHCGLNINLYGNTPTVGQGLWQWTGGPAGTVFADDTDPNTLATVPTATVYQYTWNISNGNCPTSSDPILITYGPPADNANAGVDDSVCSSEQITLNANDPTPAPSLGTGTWTIIDGPAGYVLGGNTFISNINDENAVLSWDTTSAIGNGPFSYTLVWTVTKTSCPTTTDTVKVWNFPNPTTATVTGANPRITCALTETLTANPLLEGHGTWTQVAGPGVSTFVDDTMNTTNVTVSQSGYYRYMWEVVSGPCSPPSRDTLDVDFTSPTPSVAGNDTAVCRNFDTLNANTPTVGTGTWSAVPAVGVTFDNVNDPNAEVTVVTFGTYRLYWTISAGGCTSSIDSLDIRFDEVPTAPAAGIDTSVCQNNITMYANAPAVGTGRWRQISGTGSLTIANVNLPNTLVTAPAFSISSTFELEWATFEGVCDTLRDTIQVTFFESPTNPAAGTDFEVCSNATNLAGNAITVGTGTWTQVSGPSVLTISSPNSETSAINIGAFVNDSDTFLVEWASANGNCAIERDTVQVIFHDDPTTSMAGGDIDICADTAIMAANVATVGAGIWTQISGSGVLTIDDPTNPTTTVRNPVFGANDSSIYLLEWEISNGNCTDSKDTVQVVFFLDPDIADAGGNDAICALTYTLGGNTPPYIGQGLWTAAGTNPGASAFVDDTDEGTDVTVGAYGLYKFYWTLSNGPCNPTIDSVLIRFDEFPSSSNAGVDDTVCDITYTLNGNVPTVGNGEWSLVSGPGTATFVDSSVANTVVTVSTIGTYEFEWRISNGVCADSTDNVIIIFASSNANTGILGDTVQCIGASNEVYNIPFVAGTTYDWIIPPQVDSLFGGGPLDNFFVLEFNTAGTFTIGVIPTNNFGCSSDTQTTDVTIYDFPTIDAGPDFGICSGDTVTLGGAPTASGGSGSLGYNWFPTSGLDDATAANPRAFPTFTRSYFLTVFDSISGCLTAEDTAVVTVNSSPSSQLLVLDPSICEGDSARLLITIPTGIGPFSVSLTTGPDTLVFPSVSANDTLLVGPDSTVTYSVIALYDSATNCSGTTFLGTATVNVRALPTATLSAIDTVICEGEIVNLNISVSGPTPQIYTIEYAKNGSDTTTINIVGSSGVINEAPDSTTLYTLISVTDNFRSCRVDAPSTSFNDSILIQVDSLPRATLTGGDTICAGDSAALVANITEGDGPFTVIITNLGTITNYNSGDTIWVLPSSTTIYSLASVTDTNSCEATGGGLLTGTPTVVVNPLPVAQLLGNATICFGDTTDLSVLVTVGTGPYTVVIDNGDTVMNYNNLDPIPVAPAVTTTYNLLEVTDTFGCSTFAPSASLTGSPQVTVNPLPTAQVQSNDTICFGETSVLTFSMTGATPFTVTFRNNTTGQDSTINTVGVATSINLTLGPDTTTVYSLVSVADGNGCIDSINNPVSPGFGDTVEIFVRPKPAANLRADTTICAGETGHLFVDVTSGVAPYTINMNGIGVINNYQSGDTIFVSPTDTTTFFIIQLTDSNGCVVSAGDTLLPDTVVFNVNPLPFGDLSGDATICLGDSTPLEVAIGPFAGPYIVELTNGEFDSSYYAGDSIWVSPITTTTYGIVKLTDSTTGCSISAPDATLTGTATVTVNPLPTAQIADNDTICFGETAILTFSMTGQAPFTVTYRDNLTMQDSTFMTIGLATSRNITVAPLDTTIYSLVSVIDANGCVDSINNPNNPSFGDSVTIMVRPEPVANFTVLASVDTICAGDVSYLTANLTVGTEPYTISVSNGVGVINNFNSGDTIIVNPLVTTQYWIEQLTDADGCVVMAGSAGLPDTVTVQVDPLPTANLSGDATICFGDSTPLVLAMGPGTGPFIVELDNGAFDSSYYDMDSIWVSPTATTTYNIVRITDSVTGCVITAPDATLTGTATVTVNPLPTAQIADNDTICFGETAILTFSMTGQAPFTVTYRDNLTMQDSTFMTIGLATSRNITVAPLDTTIYSLVSVIDANGCVDSINNPNNPSFGDSVTIMVRPEPVANFTVLASVDTICAGDVSYLTANLTVGTEPYTISVSNGVGVINNFNSGDTIIVNPLVTTQYWIEQLTDADGCVVMAGSAGLPDTVTVQVDPLPTANLSGDATICFGDSTPLVLAMGPGTGPFIVELDNGAFDSSYYDMDSIWVSPTATTTYNIVRITDSVTGCVITAPDATLTGTATVTVNPLPTAQIADNDTICFGETAILTFSMTGQAPFTVTYRDNLTMQDSTFMTIGLATSRNITVAPLDTTIYSLVSVIDANGCVDSINNPNNPSFGDSVTIMVRPEPVANFTVLASVDTICAGDVSYLTANLTVGTEPYTISVSNGVGVINNFNSGDTIIVNPLVTTQYWIEQLTDADGCVVMAGSAGLPDTVTVQVDPLPTANLSGDATICFGDSTPLVLAMGPGTGPFIVELDNGAFDSSYYDMDSIWVSPTATTTYNIVRITDSVTGCVITAPDATLTGTATVTVNPLPTAQISQDDTICFDDNVVLTLSMTGQSPFTVTFRDNTRMVDSTIVTIGTNTSHLVTVSPDSTTLYSLVSVIDGNGCVDSINNPISPGFGDTIEIVVDSLPIADLVIDPLTDTICNLDTAFLIVNVTTGPGPYTVQISNGVGTINNYVSGTPIPVTPSADADYKILLLQDANGCSVTDGHPNIDTTVTVTVNPLPVVELKLDRNEICLGDSAQLFWSVAVGADPIRVVIDDDPTDTISAGINDSIWVSPIDTTTYSILYFEDGNGCAVSAPNPNISGTPTLIVNPLATASMFQDDTICYGETAELIFRIQGANAPYTVTYLDTGGAPITQFSVVDSTITPWLLEPGLNTFTLTNVVDDKGCIANLSADTIVDILVHELPTVVISGDTTVCEDEPVTLNFDLTGVGPFNVVYTNGITTDTAIGLTGPSDTVVVNLSPSPIPYVYTLVEAFDSNVPDACAATDLTGSASVIMYERARISWANGQDTTICDRDSYVLTFNVDGGRPTYSVDISWSDGITVDTTLTGIGDNSILIVSPSDTTTYTIISAIEEFTTELCEAVVVDDSVVTINVNELPTADVVVNGPTDVCFGDSIQLDFTFTGTGPWDLTYLTTYAGTLDTLGVTSNPLVLKVAPPFPGSYDVSILSIVDGQTPQCQVFAPDANITGLASFTSHGLPTASLNPLGLTTVCRGDSTDLLVVAAGGTPPYRIFISDGAGYNVDTTFNSNTIIIPVAPTATTTFRIDSMMDSNALTPAGCMADTSNLTGQVLVTVNTRPTIGISGVDTICSFENSSFQIDVTGTGPWFIQYSDGTNTFPTVANSSPHTVTVINPGVGTNVYKIVSVQDNGIVPSCPQDSLPTDSAVIHVNDLPTAQLSGDTTICNGDLLPLALDFGVTNGPFTVRIVDGNGVPYTFTGLQSPTDTVLIPYTQTGLQTYFLDSVADEATNCEPLFAVGQAIVTIQPTVTVNLTGSDTICDGTFGSGFLGFDFTDPNGPAQGIFDVEILRNGTPVDTVFGVVSGVLVAAPDLQVGLNNYTVGFARYAIDPFCDLVVGTGADILVYPKPTATVQDDDSICFGSSTQLTFELTGTGPWDIRYLAGFTNEDTVATASPFTITVAPSFTTTYSLVEVTDANNCTESAFPITDSTEATVTVFQLPTAQLRINGIFGTSAAYCEEDTAALQVLLTGLGPFDIEIEDDQGNTFQRSGFNSGDTVQIHPPLGVSVKYWLKSVTDANQPACNPATLLDTMTIFQDPLPTADLNGDTTICLGATAPLTFDLTGVGPWTIRYYDGTFISQPINVTSSPFVLSVNPFTTTTYKIFDVVDAGTQNSCTIDSAHMNVTGSATVTVAPEVKAGFTFISNDKCGDPTITFTDTTTPPNVYSYFWRFGDGDTSTAQNPVHTYNNTTLNVETYVVTMIATTAVAPLGCTDSASVQISVNPDIQAQLTVSEDSGCAPLTITFESTGPAVIRYWDFENGGTDLQPGNPSIDYEFANTGLSDLTYNVWHVVENQFGCRDTIIQDIVVHPLPQPAFTANPQVHQWPIVPVNFTNNTPNLNDNTYFWDFGDGVGAHIGPSPPPYTYPTWGDFNVVLTATTPFNCVDSFVDLVQVLPQLPIAALPGDTAIGCEGFEYTFTSTSEFAFTYEWKFSDGQTFNSETVTRTFQAAGGNGAPRFIGVTLVVTGLGGFQDSVIQDVIAIVNPIPSAAFTTSFDTVFAPNNSVNFNNFSRYYDSLKWDFGDGTVDYRVNPTHTYTKEGNYEITLVTFTDEGCTDTTTRPMVVRPTANIFVPNVFIPNPGGPNGGDISQATGQNINTIFYPVPNKPVKDIEFQVFNRWGEVIFESKDINKGWDGYIRENLAEQSVYIYRVDVKFQDGSEETIIGDVTLLR